MLIHELGHLLLHLGTRNQRYWKFRSAMINKIDVDPVFFQIFNVLLDEQLERILRDVKSEWRAWFNRLEFYARGIDLLDLKKSLAPTFASIYGDSVDPRDIDLSGLEEDGYIRTYDQKGRKFATILSSEFFSISANYGRPFAFYYVLRHPLSRKTLNEDWLKECLDYIPKHFKSLDLFSLHRLAVKIYERMQENAACLTAMAFGDKEHEVEEIAVAGRWKMSPEIVDLDRLVSEREQRKRFGRGRGGGIELKTSVRHRRVDPPPNPEGEPPPPRVKKERVVDVRSRPPLVKPGRERVDNIKGGGWSSMWNDLLEGPGVSTGGTGGSRGKGGANGGKSSLSAKALLQQKLQSGRISAKEKSRLRKEMKREEQLQKKESAQNEPTNEKDQSFQETNPGQSQLKNLDTAAIERKLGQPPPTFNPRQMDKKMVASLNKQLNKIRQERQPSVPIKIRHTTAEETAATDFKNNADTLTYPEPETIYELLPDPVASRSALLKVRPFIPLLRPFFSVVSVERELEERLFSGRHILSSGIKKHAIYGETRIFKDQRFMDLEEYSQVHISVLIDTSASMNTDYRIAGAKVLATLLAACFEECLNLESLFLGYNESIYRCGTHWEHAVNSLAPKGKTNEAAALDHVRKQVGSMPQPLKIVIVLSDGLPTSCSVASVQHLVKQMEKRGGYRFLYGALSDEPHPAYRPRVNLKGELDRQKIIAFGTALYGLLM